MDSGRDEEFGTGLAKIQMVVDLLSFSAAGAVAAIAPLVHPEMKVLAAPGVAPARRYQSREDFLAYFAEIRALGISIRPDVSQVRLSPEGSVLVEGRLKIAGPTGTDEIPAWFVYTFRDGLIGSLENHLDPELAARAAGIVDGPASVGY